MTVNMFIWYMKWWIWLLLGISLSGAIIYVMKLNVERRVAQMALALEREVKLAEIDHVKSMKERELARLKLRSIANQIRPHFILNALNTIGASLPLKSKAERLLNLLSGNLNKLFDQSVSERNTQTLESEWLQCVDTIEMNRIIYLPELRIIEDLHLEEFKSIIIPIGLLHIPIENALLHGLRNRISGPYELSIHSECSEEYLTIEIVDNGIGIKVSRLQSNARKHGSGLKNIWESLSIYNNLNENHLSLVIDDKMENGTRVKIQIPLNYTYEI